MMRYLMLIVLACLGACRTNPETGATEIDPVVVEREMSLLAGDLRDAATAVDDADLQERLLRLADAADTLGAAVVDGDAVAQSAALALAIIEEIEQGSDLTDEQMLALFAAKVAIRRVEVYFG